jgi:hypothetical protein
LGRSLHPESGLAAAGLGRLDLFAHAGLAEELAFAHISQQTLLDALALEDPQSLFKGITVVNGYFRIDSPPISKNKSKNLDFYKTLSI